MTTEIRFRFLNAEGTHVAPGTKPFSSHEDAMTWWEGQRRQDSFLYSDVSLAKSGCTEVQMVVNGEVVSVTPFN